MFYNTSITEIDLTNLTTDNITDMSFMFAYSKLNFLNMSQNMKNASKVKNL